MVKFGKQIKRLADESQLNHCIAYDVLKKAINVVVADKKSAIDIDADLQVVSETFGQTTGAFAGSVRPPDSRFHSLLQHELAKVNRFFNLEMRTLLDTLREAQELGARPGRLGQEALLDFERLLDSCSEKLIAIEHFRRLNFTGFRKIVKKFDKQREHLGEGSLSSWFLPALWREPFVAESLDPHLLALAWGYAALRRHHNGPEAATPAAATKTQTFWLMPPARMRALCTLIKRFNIVVPASAAPTSSEAGHKPSSAEDYAGQMKRLLHSMASEGPARGPCRLKSDNSLIYYDSPDFSQYIKRVQGEGPCGLRCRQTLPSGQTAVWDGSGYIEQDGSPEALGANAFTVTPQVRSLQTQGRPVAVVGSSRVLLQGDTQETMSMRIALDEDVQFSQAPIGPASLAPSDAIDFPYCLLEVASVHEDLATGPWLEELWSFAALRTVQGFSLGAHAVATLYKDKVPRAPQWYQHLQTMESSAPPEAWGLLLEWRAAVIEEGVHPPTAGDLILPGAGGAGQLADAPSPAGQPATVQVAGQPPPSQEKTLLPIEPKNFMASERTMLEWLHTTLAVAFLGIGLWKYSLSLRGDGPMPQPVALGLLNAATASSFALGCYALALVAVAVVFAWYAVLSHVRRLDALFENKHTERIFNRRTGPGLFAFCVGLALVSHLGAQVVPLWLALGTGDGGGGDGGEPAARQG